MSTDNSDPDLHDHLHDWPTDKAPSEMTHDEKLAFLEDVEQLDLPVSEHAAKIRRSLEADRQEGSA